MLRHATACRPSARAALPQCCSLPHGIAAFSGKCSLAAQRRLCVAARAEPERKQSEGQPPVAAASSWEAPLALAALSLFTAAEPAHADVMAANPFAMPSMSNSLYVTLALFLMCVPGAALRAAMATSSTVFICWPSAV
jgi:hypothetical protein